MKFVVEISTRRLAKALGVDPSNLAKQIKRDTTLLPHLYHTDTTLEVKLSELIPLESVSCKNGLPHPYHTATTRVPQSEEKSNEERKILPDEMMSLSNPLTKKEEMKKEEIKETSKVLESKKNPLQPDRVVYDWYEDGWRELFLEWLKYKRSKGQTYKSEASLKVAYNKLKKDSKNNLTDAKRIIENAISANYAGFFPLKEVDRSSIGVVLRNNDLNKYDKDDEW